MSSVNAKNVTAVADQNMVTASIVVNRGQAAVFSVFVDRLADWWPIQSYSLGREQVKTVVVEQHVGGRIYEVRADGESDWGIITNWNPPHQFMLRWDVTPGPATHVELNFQKLTEDITRVSVEHTGWENVDPALLQNCSYTEGWREALSHLADECMK
jgi:regulation of enolase protein 1 (concanavalin A-like superfamily)